MNEKGMIQRNVEEFSRLQRYMLAYGKDAKAYPDMHNRYVDLKAILQASGVNLTELE